jgi:hypothetical protein
MPAELRQLVFNNDELREALDVHVNGHGDPLPAGQIHGATIAEDGRMVALAIRNGDGSGTHTTEMPIEDVAAALIGFCKSHSIPLPRASRKYLIEAGGTIGIRMVSNSEHVVEIIEDGP